MAKLYTLDGTNIKGISLTDSQSWIDAGFTDWFPDGTKLTQTNAYSINGWLHRCVNIRASTMAAMPWSVYRGENEVATSDGDNDAVTRDMDWVDDLPSLLYLAEGALTILSTAYVYKQRTRGKRIDSLKWLAPTTMQPKWTRDGIDHFERRIGSDVYRLLPEDVVYFRLPNMLHETEPAPSPVAAALADIGVLVNLTEFASQFFKRGAIRATLLTVDGMPQEAERQRLKSWWGRAMAGISNAFGAEVVSAAVRPVVVGDGIESLNNDALTAEKRESISTALGVPHSLVMSNAANFATAQADRLNFYDTTIIPASRIIERALNRQLFDAMGYRFMFRPEALNVYQEDEQQRAQAYALYRNAGMPASLVAELLGITLPEGWEYTDLDEDPTPQTITVVPQEQRQIEQSDMDDAPEDDARTDERKAAEIETFKRWLKRNPNRAGKLDAFKSDVLSDEDKATIAAEFKAQGDGDAEGNPFPLTLPDGDITPDWWRATKAALQLDANDPEAEQAARMAIERRAAREMTRSLEEWLATALDGLTEAEVQQLAYRLRNNQATFRDVLQRALVQSADLGVSVAVEQFETVGYGFDYTLANAGARDWARRYTDDLLAQLNTTNDRIVGEAVARWVDNGEPLQSLINDLTPAFGRRRAELIASTEVTRAYAEANRIAFEESGVVERIEWRTANDERVCPVCGPLNGARTSAKNPRFSDMVAMPPAHPRCRCWVVAVIEDATESQSVSAASSSQQSVETSQVKDKINVDVRRKSRFFTPTEEYKATVQESKKAVYQVNKVHKMPASVKDGTMVDIFDDASDKAMGRYRYNAPDYDGKRFSILMNQSILKGNAVQTRSTLVHEIGHWIDDVVFGNASNAAELGEMKDVFDAIKQSKAYKDLQHKIANPNDRGLIIGGFEFGVSSDHLTYLASNEELWARAYAQWVADSVKDFDVLNEFYKEANSGIAPTQWGKDDFTSIKNAITMLFRSRGLLR